MQLHPKLGVNPKLTVCVHCGKEMDELVFVGAHTSVFRCDGCGVNHIGGLPRNRRCHCGSRSFTKAGEIGEHDRLPASRLCDECQAKQDETDRAVAEGGVYWRCVVCGSAGAIKSTSEYALAIRQAHGEEFTKAPYKPCGVEFDKDNCPVCGEGGSDE